MGVTIWASFVRVSSCFVLPVYFELKTLRLNCSYRYHVKYMFVGDGVKAEVEKVIRSLRPALQLRLRFISHHGREDATPAN